MRYPLIKKRAITLIEVLIVIAILSLLTGLIAINIRSAVREQQFKSEVLRVVDELKLAQDILLILGTGSVVKFELSKEKDSILYQLDTTLPLPKAWEKFFKKKNPPLKTIHYIQFEGAEGEGKLDIEFLSEETGMSKGILRLSTSEKDEVPGALTSYICLPGYPHPIEYHQSKTASFCDSKKEEEFLKNLSRTTYEEIQELPHHFEKKRSDTP